MVGGRGARTGVPAEAGGQLADAGVRLRRRWQVQQLHQHLLRVQSSGFRAEGVRNEYYNLMRSLTSAPMRRGGAGRRPTKAGGQAGGRNGVAGRGAWRRWLERSGAWGRGGRAGGGSGGTGQHLGGAVAALQEVLLRRALLLARDPHARVPHLARRSRQGASCAAGRGSARRSRAGHALPCPALLGMPCDVLYGNALLGMRCKARPC